MASTRSSTMGMSSTMYQQEKMSSTMYQQDLKKHTGKDYGAQPRPSKHKTCILSHNTAHGTCAGDMGAARIHQILLPPAQQAIGGSKVLKQELAHDAGQMRILMTLDSF